MRAITSRGSNGILRSAGDDAEQFLGVRERFDDLGPGRGTLLLPVQALDDAAADPDGVLLVDREVVGEAGLAGMHLGAAEGFVVGFLTGRHLHEGRSGEEHLGSFLDHDDVIGHAGDVRAARRRIAEDEGDGRDTRGGELGEVAEHAATGYEHFLLSGKVRAAGFHEGDDGGAGSAGRCRWRGIPSATSTDCWCRRGQSGRWRRSGTRRLPPHRCDDGAGADREVAAPTPRAGTVRGTASRGGRGAVRFAPGRAACRASCAARCTSRRRPRALGVLGVDLGELVRHGLRRRGILFGTRVQRGLQRGHD